MKESKKKSDGKSKSNMMSRPDFLKATGAAAAGAGAAAVGLGGTAQAYTPPGAETPDTEGSLVSVVKLDPSMAYAEIPYLLQTYIHNEIVYYDENSTQEQVDAAQQNMEDSWGKITARINYMYAHMQTMFQNIWQDEPGAKERILNDVSAGKKLVFKPNWVTPLEDINPYTYGPGLGWGGSTAWPFMAAMLRYFHDHLDISYDDMVVAEGGDKHEFDTAYLNLPFYLQFRGFPITDLAIYEGRIEANGKPVWYGGIGFYFARKYLADRHDPTHTDDPMAGYAASITPHTDPDKQKNGWTLNYYLPGQAYGLMLYNLNRVTSPGSPAHDRGFEITVPEHDYQQSPTLILHEVLDGNPIVNAAKLKVHPLSNATLCMKNMHGAPPAWAENPDHPSRADWIYSIPHIEQGVENPYTTDIAPCNKGGAPHDTWFGPLDKNMEPKFKAGTSEYEIFWYDNNGNHVPYGNSWGIEGVIWDTCMALKNDIVLNVIDGIIGANYWHEATGPIGVALQTTQEGLMMASTDIVAISKFGYRYMFKKVPRAYSGGAFLNWAMMPTLSNGNLETVFGGDHTTEIADMRNPIAEEIGLGSTTYNVKGKDVSDGGKLVTVQQHFGKMKGPFFEEIITSYNGVTILPGFSVQWSLRKYMEAGDTLSGGAVPLVHGHPDCISLFNNGFPSAPFTRPVDTGDIANTLDFPPTNVSRGWLGAVVHSTRVIFLKEQMYFDMGLLDPGLAGFPFPGFNKGIYRLITEFIKCTNADWNAAGHYFLEHLALGFTFHTGVSMATTEVPPGGLPDPFFGNKWGTWSDPDGTTHICWPSPHFALWCYRMNGLFGSADPNEIAAGNIGMGSAYGQAWLYALIMGDFTQPWTFVIYLPPELALHPGTGQPLLPNVIPSTDSGMMFKTFFWMPGKDPNSDPPDDIWPDSAEFPLLGGSP